MDPLPLTLVELLPKKKRIYWHIFEPSRSFEKPWWKPESSVGTFDHWMSVRSGNVEVARCKFVLDARAASNPVLGALPHGQLDILALEVAVSARRRGVGRGVLAAICELYPLPRLTALNDDERSRGFWDAVGWIRHESPLPFLRSERVTYSQT